MNKVIMNKTVEELYMSMAIDEFVKRALEGEISDYIKNAYVLCQPYLGNISLQDFAAKNSNYNPNKSGIGEKAQFQYLKNQFPLIKKLSNHGKNSLSLSMIDGQYAIVKGKSNIKGIKTIDAIDIDGNIIKLFLFKSVDIGSLSDNVGGGHQTNVQDEVLTFVEHASKQKIFLDGKEVKFYVIVDGRSAADIIAAAIAFANGCAHLVISESINL